MRVANAATTTEIAPPRNANPLPDKVINADIRIRSIEDELQRSGQTPPTQETLVESTPTKEHGDASTESQKNWWAEAIAENMDLADGYTKVAVLLIKWEDGLDELMTGDEARELATLFSERFHYQTKTVELNVREKPQHQLNKHVSQFICEHDGTQSLLIVYYTGHGVYQKSTKTLQLTVTQNPDEEKGLSKIGHASWNMAEEQLRQPIVEADVLTILDTCYSSNLVKSSRQEEKKFELLSACYIDETTAAPGPNSYTRAFIDAATHFLDKDPKRPISTFSLTQRINEDKRRIDTPSHLWGRSRIPQPNQEHIFLTPLSPAKVDALHQYRPRANGYLTLRFGLRDASLNQAQIDYMAKLLTKAWNNKDSIGLRRIDCIEMKPAPPLSHFERVTSVLRVKAQWKRVIARNKERKQSQNGGDANGSVKRVCEDTNELPDAKRQHLGPIPPPSPAVSDA
ncbi:uncharacterized protein J4E87_004078 [Alternaria ethzedia]|uniref:uncharacterized protein n=1 Tax=Alternaria ethzedia TaxID=181014 RepID=UPI0020C2F006|nr:uncharacterized protein J4E87_004078 [Alternaria ethzedia]KAI4627514.1 hypothetical protein J4E87_004078 [Alternaria ethzedia]KAI4633597.1 hypothetical protein J4E80_000963 [Alternaria sp. BMP 0032]